MSWTSFIIGVVAGGVLVGLVTTETGKSVSSTTGKAVSKKYAQLVE